MPTGTDYGYIINSVLQCKIHEMRFYLVCKFAVYGLETGNIL